MLDPFQSTSPHSQKNTIDREFPITSAHSGARQGRLVLLNVLGRDVTAGVHSNEARGKLLRLHRKCGVLCCHNWLHAPITVCDTIGQKGLPTCQIFIPAIMAGLHAVSRDRITPLSYT